MITKKLFGTILAAAGMLLIMARPAVANNLNIDNVSLEKRIIQEAGSPIVESVTVEFDISWDNSWRDDINHDAVWLVFKILPAGGAFYRHAKVACSVATTDVGQKDPPGYDPGSSKNMEFFVPDDNLTNSTNDCYGTFYRRKGAGSGTVISKDVRVPINIADLSVSPSTNITVKVVGVEMVYVSEGEFFAGAAGPQATFSANATAYTYWYVSADGAMTTSAVSGTLYYTRPASATSSTTVYNTGAVFSIPAAYPVGYNAFYAMKYEITEQQYVDFLNMNAVVTKTARGITNATSGGKGSNAVTLRNTVSGDSTVPIASLGYSTTRPHRAVTYLNSHDWLTYLDWMALRPMSELEFEKLCVGPIFSTFSAVFPWGTNFPAQIIAFSTSVESGVEVVRVPGRAVLANFGSVVFGGLAGNSGPVRSGIGAIPNASRAEAGAGYYGALELAGNVWEFVVTVGDTVGVTFSGLHGDGEITTTGYANVINWPSGCFTSGAAGICNGTGGVGLRGGSWATTIGRLYTSDRNNAAFTVGADNNRAFDQGGRGVRSCTNCL